MADAAEQEEGSTVHNLVVPVEEEAEEYMREEQEAGGLQKQAEHCWGCCESALFLQDIPLRNGLAVCTCSKTDLGSSLPENRQNLREYSISEEYFMICRFLNEPYQVSRHVAQLASLLSKMVTWRRCPPLTLLCHVSVARNNQFGYWSVCYLSLFLS